MRHGDGGTRAGRGKTPGLFFGANTRNRIYAAVILHAVTAALFASTPTRTRTRTLTPTWPTFTPWPTWTASATRTKTLTPTPIFGWAEVATKTPGPSDYFPQPWPVPAGVQIDANTTPHPGFTPNIYITPYPCREPACGSWQGCCTISVGWQRLTPGTTGTVTPWLKTGMKMRRFYRMTPPDPLYADERNRAVILTTFTATPTYRYRPPPQYTSTPYRSPTRGFTRTATVTSGGPTTTPVPGDECILWGNHYTCTPTPRTSRTPTATPTPPEFRTEAFFTAPGQSEKPATVGGSAGSGLWWWFFSPDNPELFTAVVNGCATNGYWWVKLYAGTNVAVRVSITRRDGTNKTYSTPSGAMFPAMIDTKAFPCVAP